MNTRLRTVALITLFILAHSINPAAGFPATQRDARGQAVTMAAAPKRIISLAPAITEMLFAIGLGPKIVGDTAYCDYPLAAKQIPKIGDMNPNYEKVIALRPDLVIADNVANRSSIDRLTALRLPLFVIHPTTLNEVEATLITLGALTGHAKNAAAVVKSMEAKRARVRAMRNQARRIPPRVLLVIGTQPLWAAGPGTFLNDVLAEAGGLAVPANLRGYSPVSLEAVLAKPPDLIMASAHDQSELRSDPHLRSLSAIRRNRFFTVSDPEMIVRPGPRLADALLEIANSLNAGVK